MRGPLALGNLEDADSWAQKVKKVVHSSQK